jgi:AcrR family transcriptional regulator
VAAIGFPPKKGSDIASRDGLIDDQGHNVAVSPAWSDRHGQILRCATELFQRNGYTPTTMDQVAEAAKITKRTLYRYVGDKEQLLFDIHDQFTSRTLVAHLQHLPDEPLVRFEGLVRSHIEIVVTHRRDIQVFFDERKHLSRDNLREVEERRNSYESFAADVVAAVERPNLFKPGSSRILAQAMLGGLTEMYRWYDPNGRLPMDAVVELVTSLFLGGIVPGRRSSASLHAIEVPEPPSFAVDSDHPLELIMKSAAKLFTMNGFHATSTQEIAELAGVTKGALFYHVRTKQDLLANIHLSVLRRGTAATRAALDAGGSDVEVLTRMIYTYLLFLGEHRNEMAVINENARYLETSAISEIWALLRQWRDYFRRAIATGVSHGEFEVDETDIVMRLVVGMLNASYRWYRPDGRMSAQDIAATYSTLVLFGITGARDRVPDSKESRVVISGP